MKFEIVCRCEDPSGKRWIGVIGYASNMNEADAFCQRLLNDGWRHVYWRKVVDKSTRD